MSYKHDVEGLSEIRGMRDRGTGGAQRLYELPIHRCHRIRGRNKEALPAR